VVSDESTLTAGPLDTLTGTAGLPLVPALTIVWHPHLDRIGQVAPLTNLLEADIAHLSRDQPIFLSPGANTGQALVHRGISHESILDIAFVRGTFELRRAQLRTEVEVDGESLSEPRRVSSEDLRRGLIITVARRFVLCLHSIRYPITRSPTLGLLGTSDGIEDVRRSLTGAADHDMPVLLRGESGTGKELAARALHDAGPRAKAPFVAVNMALLLRERAAAELFGYKKGAFTGATADLPGHFRAAQGGTIFLDEIGLTSVDVQPMLLRVLDDREVLPLGAPRPTKIDVRIVAATDAKLERAVAEGRFEPSLYNRLNNAFNIHLPPIRERREDIGILLLHFLKSEFRDAGALQRLQDPDPAVRPWLSARDVAAVARSSLPANARSLHGLARHLVGKAPAQAGVDTHAVVSDFLSREGLSTPSGGPASTGPEPVPFAPTQESADAAAKAQLIAALEKTNWNRLQAARALGVARSTFYLWLAKYPDVDRLVKIELADLLGELTACEGNVERLATKLGISPALLLRRLASKR
jgi:two-component system, NtrC family, nitrogen regulation response regulator GlnG